MLLAYPPFLPCVSRIEGHSASLSAGVVRTPMEAGNSRQRRMHRVLPHRLELSFMVAQELYADWLAWLNTYGYDWFSLTLPGLAAARAGANVTATPVRLVSDISAELVNAHRLWYWRCRVSAEYLPSATDLELQPVGQWIVAELSIQPQDVYIVAGTPPLPSPDVVNAGKASAPSAWA